MTFKELINEHKELLTDEILENGCIYVLFNSADSDILANEEYSPLMYEDVIELFESNAILLDSMSFDSIDTMIQSLNEHIAVLRKSGVAEYNRIADILESQNFEVVIDMNDTTQLQYYIREC